LDGAIAADTFRRAPKPPFFCCEPAGPCYKPAAPIAMMLDEVDPEIMNVIDFNGLEHDGHPKTALRFSTSCPGIAA